MNLKKHIDLIFLGIILLLAFFLRAQEVLSENYLFLIDQGRDMMDVKGIVFDHHLTLLGPYTGLQGVFQGPGWYYLLSIPTIISGGDPLSGVWLMVIISITAILLMWYFLKETVDGVTALIAAFLITISPEAIAAATFTWNPHPMWLLIPLYLFFFYLSIEKDKRFFLVTFPIISLMFHFETALGLYILFSTFAYIIYFKRRIFGIKYLWLGFLLSFVFFLPQVIFDLRHDFLMSRSVIKVLQGNNQGLAVTGEEKDFIPRLSDHIMTMRDNFNASFISFGVLRFLPNLILALLTVGVISIFTIFRKAKFHGRKLMKFVLTNLFLLLFGWIVLFPFPIRSWYITGFEIFYIVITSLVVRFYMRFKLSLSIIILLFIIMAYGATMRIVELYTNTDSGGIAKIKGKIDAIDYIYNDAKTKDFNLLVFAPPVYTDNYDYILWWYGERKYGFMPKQEKNGTLYLLIEPDPGKPLSYRGWLETVIKDGEIVKTIKIPSGFIIQKRIFK